MLVWHWGRRGAGPRFASELTRGLSSLPETTGLVSLSAQAELLHVEHSPSPDLVFPTYTSWPGMIGRLAAAPWLIGNLVEHLALLRPDFAISAMPALLDPLMFAALSRRSIPAAIIVHDAERHPGDGLFLQMALQHRLIRRAAMVVALSRHVGGRLLEQRLVSENRLFVTRHPPFNFGAVPERTPHGGPFRLLFFGRLRRYKGLDLLVGALERLPAGRFTVRVVGSGPPSAELVRLAALEGVSVENRWVPEAEVGCLLAWADALVLPYREASQSGVAAAALAAGRLVIATRVGGLPQQLEGERLARLTAPEPAALAECLKSLPGALPQPIPVAAPADAWAAFAADILAAFLKMQPT